MDPFTKSLATSPRWYFHLLCIIPAVSLLIVSTFFAISEFWFWAFCLLLPLFIMTPIVTLTWFVKLPFGVWAVLSSKIGLSDRDILNWLVYPVVLFLTCTLMANDVPFKVAFALSRNTMNDLAQRVRSAPRGVSFPNQRIACFNAKNISRAYNGVIFNFGEDPDYFTDPPALWYSPDGQAPTKSHFSDLNSPTYTRMDDHWFYVASYAYLD